MQVYMVLSSRGPYKRLTKKIMKEYVAALQGDCDAVYEVDGSAEQKVLRLKDACMSMNAVFMRDENEPAHRCGTGPVQVLAYCHIECTF